MAEKYTISGVMATGKSSPTYGTEYYIQFVENEASFPLWFKTAPTVGQVISGDIEGSKFKKEKKEWTKENPTTQATTAGNKPAPSARYKDNSDGQRQGMCFNNAAQYVMAISPEALSPTEWAKAVSSYAQALYLVSELNKDEQALETVASIFGAGTEKVK